MIIGATAAFVLSLLSAWLLVSLAPRITRIDKVGLRSLHIAPTPRGGGLAFAIAVPIGFLFAAQADGWSLPWRAPMVALAVAIPVAAIGFLDDVRECGALLRISFHASAAVAGCLLVTDQSLAFWVVSLAVVSVVWSINLANFMDGADGFLATEAITVFTFMGIASMASGVSARGAGLGMLAWCAAAGIAGFLCWNLPKARIFMGDVGSGWIGAMVGLMIFGFLLTDPWIACGSVALAAPFAADASICLIRRAIRRERIWQAHSMHGYQRFVRSQRGNHAVLLAAWTAVNVVIYLPLAIWVCMAQSITPFAIAAALGCLQAIALGSGLPQARQESEP